jgi:hypothetical protein
MIITNQLDQNFLDLAIQYAGDVSAAFEIAHNNNHCLSDIPATGSVIQVGDKPLNIQMVRYFADQQISIATSNSTKEENKVIGIGRMRVGSTFIVK